jgi:hypothetical protein
LEGWLGFRANESIFNAGCASLACTKKQHPNRLSVWTAGFKRVAMQGRLGSRISEAEQNGRENAI